MKAFLDSLMVRPIKIKSAVTALHPDFSHSLLPFVAVDEPELEGACRPEEAGVSRGGEWLGAVPGPRLREQRVRLNFLLCL